MIRDYKITFDQVINVISLVIGHKIEADEAIYKTVYIYF